MYDVVNPDTGSIERLGHQHVISSHKVSRGHVVYLRSSTGRVLMWTTPSADRRDGTGVPAPATAA